MIPVKNPSGLENSYCTMVIRIVTCKHNVEKPKLSFTRHVKSQTEKMQKENSYYGHQNWAYAKELNSFFVSLNKI